MGDAQRDQPTDAGGPGSHGRLDRYHAKRDPRRTPEPMDPASASGTDAPGRTFVVQRHRARRRHYDLRLEIDGVLASWAVPKGPTLDPHQRRLAVHVEDHPLDYATFEGVIPAGEYGAGDVVVWDRGSYELTRGDDPANALADGELHVALSGEKLAGRFALVRTSGRGRSRAADQRQDTWLLVHADDDTAVPGWDAEDHPRSVLSGRTNDEVAAAQPPDDPVDQPSGVAPVGTNAPGGSDGFRWRPTPADLEALDELGPGGTWQVDGIEVELTHLDRVLAPGRGGVPLTKADLVRHAARVAPLMLAYLAGRAVNLQRFPRGLDGDGFWQKQVPAGAPDWVTRWRDPEARPGRTEQYLVVDHPAALVWLANQSVLEIHPWTSRAASSQRPSWVLVDIDPGPATSFDDVVTLARLYRTALEHLGLAAAPKVTGKRGIQIWIPVEERYDFDETSNWVGRLSHAVGAQVPDLVSWAWRTEDRNGLARLDDTQNARHKTLVAPWSTRPAPGLPVSVPIRWDELDDPALAPDRWGMADVADRIAEFGDPMAPLVGLPQRLPAI